MLEELFLQQEISAHRETSLSPPPWWGDIRGYGVSCARTVQLECPPASFRRCEILFCKRGSLHLDLQSGRRGHLTDRDILLLSNRHDLQQIQLSEGFQGTLLSSDLPSADPGEISPTGVGPRGLEALLEAHKGCAVIRGSLWCDVAFTMLDRLSLQDQIEYCVMKSAELLFLLSHRLLSLSSPVSAEYYDRHQTDVARQVHDDMIANLSQSLTIAQLAARHHVSQTMLKDCFRSLYGKPIHTFLREQRMQRAAELLRTTSLPVIQIAAQVGYNSVSQFGQAFRKQFHLSPSHYRRATDFHTLE